MWRATDSGETVPRTETRASGRVELWGESCSGSATWILSGGVAHSRSSDARILRIYSATA